MGRGPSDSASARARAQLRPIDGGAAPSPTVVTGDELEARLVARARAGDLDAWARLYQDHYDGLFRHVCFLSGDPSVAEDLAQETFARAMTHVAQFDARSSFAGWIRGIALNVARMHWRRASTTDRAHAHLQRIQHMQRTTGQEPDLERAQLQDDRMRILYEVLAMLPVRLREAFVLRELEGLSCEEAGAQIGISPGNVAVRSSRARARIRKVLVKHGLLPEGEP